MDTAHLTSKKLVAELDDATVATVMSLRARQIFPQLAVIAVGETSESVFVRLKRERGRAVGVDVSVYRLPVTVKYADLESVINFLNDDPEVHGVILQLPLPKNITNKERDQLLQLIKPEKDVDGLGRGSYIKKADNLPAMTTAAIKAKQFLPTTAQAIMQLAETGPVDWSGEVVVVGKGVLVGQPLHQLLTALSIKHQWVDKDSADCDKQIAAADVVVAGTNDQKAFLTDKTVKMGATVLAAGREADHYTLDTHVEMVSAEGGGIGPLTISLLLANTVMASVWQNQT